MATYMVNAPNRNSVTVSCPLGTFTMTHASYMMNDALARFFPNIFVKIADTPVEVVPAPPVVETPAPVVEKVAEVPAPPVVEPVTTPPVAAAPAPEVKVRKKPGPKPKVKVTA